MTNKLKMNTAAQITDTLMIDRERHGYTLEYEDSDRYGAFYLSDADAKALFLFLALELTSILGAELIETLVRVAELEAEIKAHPDDSQGD